jgi:hypothetical protein
VFSWGHYIRLSEDPFQSSILLTFGVPESDNVQFVARCQIGAGGPYANVMVWADTAGLPNGTPVQMTFTDGAGALTMVDGSITGVMAEVGITGVEMALSLEDPFFSLLRARQFLRYGFPGNQSGELETTGMGPHLDAFLGACANPVAGVTGGELPQPAPSGVVAQGSIQPGCDMLGEIRSLEGTQPQRVTLANRTDGYRHVVWIDYNGNFVQLGGMNPGETITIDSYVTHPFVITDGPGNCLEVMATTAGQGQFDVTAPGQFFGTE